MKPIGMPGESKSNFILDPRTKILILLCTNIVIIGGGFSGVAIVIRPLFATFPFFLLILERKWRTAMGYMFFVAMAMTCEIYLLHRTSGAVNLMIAIFSGVLSRFVPGFVLGFYLVSTTEISEFIAAMERLCLPRAIIIPFAVMMRFFPTVKEESTAIGDAMKMRGIRLGGGNPLAMLEYRVVPLLISTVKIGEELSAAALTRGLGGTARRTNICKIGFKTRDWILMAFALGALLIWMIKGRQ